MTEDDELSRDLDRLRAQLPEPLRKDWVVVPKRVIQQAALACLALGASGALLVVAYALDVPALRWAWPVVIVALLLAARFIPAWRGDRIEAQLRDARRQDTSATSES